VVTHMGSGVSRGGASHAIAYCTNASRGLSTIDEFLVETHGRRPPNEYRDAWYHFVDIERQYQCLNVL